MARGHPTVACSGLALGAVPVPAGIVGNLLVVAVAALFDMATEDRRAADLDGAHHPLLLERDGVVLAKFLAVVSKDVGQLKGWPGHGSGFGSLGFRQD